MCMFSMEADVSATRIFAAPMEGGRQSIVYSMEVDAPEELSMILPIPVPKDSPDDAVLFVSLEQCPLFFDRLDNCFPKRKPRGDVERSIDALPPALAVVEVGSFVASFVPAYSAFTRLDARFRLPDEVWEGLPRYADFGFAVFMLKPGAQRVHPMAFVFPRARPGRLFFPTVHVHDGRLHDEAEFDHTLYCQNIEGLMQWEESRALAGELMGGIDATEGLVDPSAHLYRRSIRGVQHNDDVWV